VKAAVTVGEMFEHDVEHLTGSVEHPSRRRHLS